MISGDDSGRPKKHRYQTLTLAESQQLNYRKICAQLLEQKKQGGGLAQEWLTFSDIVEQDVLLPLVKKVARKDRCIVTGRVLTKGQKAIFIFTKPLIPETNHWTGEKYLEKVCLAVISDQEALNRLLEIGDINAI